MDATGGCHEEWNAILLFTDKDGLDFTFIWAAGLICRSQVAGRGLQVIRDLKIYDGDFNENVTSKYHFALW